MGNQAAQGTNVRLLDRDVFVIDGGRFVGAILWTDYRLLGNQPLAMVGAARGLNDHWRIERRGPKIASANPEHSRQLVLCQREGLLARAIHGRERPFSRALLDRMHGIARHRLKDLVTRAGRFIHTEICKFTKLKGSPKERSLS